MNKIKIIKCPTMPANGYEGAMNGNYNPWKMMNCNYIDDAEPFNSIDTGYNPRNDKDKVEMLRKYENVNSPNWLNHFNECISTFTRIELPRPVMVGNNPYFSGGLYRGGDEVDLLSGEETISDFNLFHFKVKYEDIRQPTNKEYNKYFKEFYDNAEYRVKTFEPENYIDDGSKTKNGAEKIKPHCMVVKNVNRIKK